MKIAKKFGIAAVALTLAVGAAFAQGHRRGGPGGFGGPGEFGKHMFGRAAFALDLTDQQKESAKKLWEDVRKQSEPIQTELRQNRKELADAVKANNTSGIDAITQRQGALMAQMSSLHSKAMAQFYTQLTPEQRAKADKLGAGMRERAERMRERGERMRERRNAR